LALSLSDEEKLILISVLAAAMIFVIYFEMRIMRGKNKEVKEVGRRKDEAYNQILTTRSVMNVMQRQGHDVSACTELVRQAKQALQKGRYETAIDLCDRARDELTKVRPRSEPARLEPDLEPEERELLEDMEDKIADAKEIAPAKEDYKGSRLEDIKGGNYMSAKFEMGTAKAEIRKAQEAGKDVSSAENLLRSSETAFDSGAFTKALSLAHKARKEISKEAEIETIPLKPADEEEDEDAGAPSAEESSAPLSECRNCGAEMGSDDAFCAICGAKVQRERKCLNCGTKPKPKDAFCRKCGAKIP
jgi:hypothetical protein